MLLHSSDGTSPIVVGVTEETIVSVNNRKHHGDGNHRRAIRLRVGPQGIGIEIQGTPEDGNVTGCWARQTRDFGGVHAGPEPP